MTSLGMTVTCWWQWTSVVILLVSPLLASAFTLSNGDTLSENCQWACSRRISTVPGCKCAQQKLVKRFAMLDPEVSERAQMSLLLESLLGLKDFTSVDVGHGDDGIKPGSHYMSPADDENTLLAKIPLAKRMNYMKHRLPSSADDAEADAISMVRSKKRWLSLHDDFDSQGREGDMVVANLWNDDASRKAFRYG